MTPAIVKDTTTSREERLARKLKTIDSVTSPRSSFDVSEHDRSNQMHFQREAVIQDVGTFRPLVQSTSSAFSPASYRVTPKMSTAVSNRYGANVMLPERVTLVVDGTRFVADPQLFLRLPDTMLGR